MPGQTIEAGTFRSRQLTGGAGTPAMDAMQRYAGEVGLDQLDETTLLWPGIGAALHYDKGGDPEWQQALRAACQSGRPIRVYFEVQT